LQQLFLTPSIQQLIVDRENVIIGFTHKAGAKIKNHSQLTALQQPLQSSKQKGLYTF
jgi:hypothetical protein